MPPNSSMNASAGAGGSDEPLTVTARRAEVPYLVTHCEERRVAAEGYAWLARLGRVAP